MDRQEIIAALDAEIARLHEARLLIAQSVVHLPQSKRPARQIASATVHEPLAPTAREGSIQLDKEAAVPFTRLPARKAPRQRSSKAVAKQQGALTGNVPTGPVAVPGKKSSEPAPRSGADLPAITSSASPFGQAITRGLAALHGSADLAH